jgi:N-acetylmuramoyl-L-alanine amidase
MFALPPRPAFATVPPVGRLAQRLAHLVYTEVVGGSNPSAPTIPLPRQNTCHHELQPHNGGMFKTTATLIASLMLTLAAEGKMSHSHESGKAPKKAEVPRDLELSDGQASPVAKPATNGASSKPASATNGQPAKAMAKPPVTVSNPPAARATPLPLAYSVPTNNWVALDRWAKENRLGGLTNLSVPGAPAYGLYSPPGKLVIRPASVLASWNGLELRLGFEPQLIGDQTYVHRLDIEKNLIPLLVNGASMPPGRRVIVVDPGHGGSESGTQSAEGNLEKDYTLDWGLRLAELLRGNGWTVVLTRTNDVQLSLLDRIAIADRHKADLFVSLHFNAAMQPYHAGIETYCVTPMGMPSSLTRGYEDNTSLVFPNNLFDAQNLQLALNIHQSMLAVTKGRDRGIRRARFMTVLRGQSRPAVLLEGGYLTNPDEAKLIDSEDYRQILAQAVAQALK